MPENDKTIKVKITSRCRDGLLESVDEYKEKGYSLKGGINVTTKKGVFYYIAILWKEGSLNK